MFGGEVVAGAEAAGLTKTTAVIRATASAAAASLKVADEFAMITGEFGWTWEIALVLFL